MCSAPPGEGLSLQGQRGTSRLCHVIPTGRAGNEADGSLQPRVNPPQGRGWGQGSMATACCRDPGGVTCSELAQTPIPARSSEQPQQSTVSVPPGMLQQGGVLTGHRPRFAPAVTLQERLTSSIGSGHRSLGTARSPQPHIPRHPTVTETPGWG